MRVEAGLLATAAALAALAGCASVSAPLKPARAPVVAMAAQTPAVTDLDRAVALTAELRYAEAAREFVALEKVCRAGGDAPRAAESAFWLGFCHEKLGRFDEAAEVYRRTQQEYPRTRAARQAGERLSRLAEKARGD